jgi:hypothetical protein
MLSNLWSLGLDTASARMEAENTMTRSETHSYQKRYQSDRNKHVRCSENVAGMKKEKFLQSVGL